MHTFENLNIVLTRTPTRTPTDANTNDWVTTYALQGHSPGELTRGLLFSAKVPEFEYNRTAVIRKQPTHHSIK